MTDAPMILQPGTGAIAASVYLPATPESFRAGGITREQFAALQADAPQWLVDGLASLSFQTHFTYISKGVIDLRDLIYFGLLIGICLYANTIVLDLKKAD